MIHTKRWLFVLLIPTFLFAQNNRTFTYNTVGWYNPFVTLKINDRLGIHLEAQIRRNDWMTQWQQLLYRTGINYQLNPHILLRIGYAHAATYVYGDLPINVYGKPFNENRLFEMFQMTTKEGPIEFTHRFILEQRFTGKYSSAAVEKEDQTVYTNRVRYMIRLLVPFKGKELKDKTGYITAYDEIMIGFGKNVNANVFDQNRIGALIGYRFSKLFRLEGGYIQQTLQFGRLVNGKNVFQTNSGVIVNAFFALDLSRKKEIN